MLRPDPLFVEAWREAGGLIGVVLQLVALLSVLGALLAVVIVAWGASA